jgi:tRNA nucleotidyltransferase (CCA-adding enzyme)
LLPEPVKSAVVALGELAEEIGVRAHVVGGFVRDMLLARPNLDVDVVVEGDGVEFAERAAERLGVRVTVHRRFGTAVLVFSPDLHIDVASARTEYYTRPGALPTVEWSSLRQDLLRRDFSLNAMAASITPSDFGVIADPFGGLRDLERGTLRVLHSLSFVEDPTRVFRAARFEQRFGFRMEPTTESLARRCVEMGLLDELSGARVREELFEILDEERVSLPLARLADLGALDFLTLGDVGPKRVLEETEAVQTAFRRIAGSLEHPPSRRLVMLTPLVAHGTRHEVERWGRWLHLSADDCSALGHLAERGAGTLKSLRSRRRLSDSRIHALLARFSGEALVYLHAISQGESRARVSRYVTELAFVRTQVTGDDLIGFGLTPSAVFSDILGQALSDRLDGKAVGRDEELENLRRIAKRAGLL